MPIVVAMYTLNVLHPGVLVFNRNRVLPSISEPEEPRSDTYELVKA